MKYLILTISIFLYLDSFSQIRILNPYAHFCEKIANVELKDTFNFNFKRISYDFNKDGLIDIFLSDIGTQGKAGNEWYIYFKKNKKSYNLPIKYFFADWAFYTKKIKNTVMFINYFHVSANSGYLYYNKIINKKIINLKSIFLQDLTEKSKKVEIEFSKFKVQSIVWSPRCKKSGLNNCYPTQF